MQATGLLGFRVHPHILKDDTEKTVTVLVVSHDVRVPATFQDRSGPVQLCVLIPLLPTARTECPCKGCTSL